MNRVAGGAHWRPLHLVILLLYGAFLTWPALSNGYIPSRDVLIHLLWSTNFSNQLWAGEWYPRWLDGMNGGLGSPVFFFYPPLPYYFTALLKPLFHADPEGWHQLGIAASLAVILSGFSAYGWLKRVTGISAALVGAILYMSAPYHLATDLYDRFAFAELWSFVWLPLVLLGIHSVASGSRQALPGLALAYAALILTHLPTAMIFSPVALACVIVYSGREVRVRRTLAVLGTMALGAGLAAEFLLPVLTTQQNVSLADMRAGRLSYIYNFLYYGPRFDSAFTEMLIQQGNYAFVMIAGSFVAFYLGGRLFDRSEVRQARFWLFVAIFSFAMMLPFARPVWDFLPPLQAIQFPWRFNVLLTLAATMLLALWVGSGKPRVSRLNWLAMAIVFLTVAGQSLLPLRTYMLLAASPGAPGMDKMLAQLGSINAEVREKILAARLAMDTAEYRPRWVPREVNNTSQALHATLVRIERASADAGQGMVSVRSRSPRRMILDVDMPAPGWVKLPHFYYPEWRSSVDNTDMLLPIRPSALDGLIEVKLEAGRQKIILELGTSVAERIGWWISGFSLLLICFLALRLLVLHKTGPD